MSYSSAATTPQEKMWAQNLESCNYGDVGYTQCLENMLPDLEKIEKLEDFVEMKKQLTELVSNTRNFIDFALKNAP